MRLSKTTNLLLILYVIIFIFILILNYGYLKMLIQYGLDVNGKTARITAESAVASTSAVSTASKIWPEDWNATDRIEEQIDFQPQTVQNRSIYIHLGPWGAGSWGVETGASVFQECKIQNCLLTADSTLEERADALLFRNFIYKNSPARPQGQIWVFYSLESPQNTPPFESMADSINWTATYKSDSDLVAPYEKIPDYYFKIDDTQREMSLHDYAKGKTKKVAWFVSNCYTQNDRMQYAKQLGEHIEIDIYGRCGTLHCSRNDPHCDLLLNRHYKFYLAFENTNCVEYITEKFFVHGLGKTIIPIAMGARRQDYEKVAPRHSFIHVDDFATPAQLAQHLHHLDQNDTAFNEYFRWKRGQSSIQFQSTKFWCRLCAMLNEPRKKYYRNLDAWWHRSACITDSWRKHR